MEKACIKGNVYERKDASTDTGYRKMDTGGKSDSKQEEKKSMLLACRHSVPWHVTLELDDTRFNPRLTDVGEEESERGKDGIQEGSHKSGPDPMDMVEDDIVDAENWSNEPDDKDVDEGEENCPDESQGDRQDASDNSIQPQSDVSEDDEG